MSKSDDVGLLTIGIRGGKEGLIDLDRKSSCSLERLQIKSYLAKRLEYVSSRVLSTGVGSVVSPYHEQMLRLQ